jgi:hypothetical protein
VISALCANGVSLRGQCSSHSATARAGICTAKTPWFVESRSLHSILDKVAGLAASNREIKLDVIRATEIISKSDAAYSVWSTITPSRGEALLLSRLPRFCKLIYGLINTLDLYWEVRG